MCFLLYNPRTAPLLHPRTPRPHHLIQREAVKDKESLFANNTKHGINKSLRPEDEPFSATDLADLDDNTDDDVPLVELAKRSVKQALNDGHWQAINPVTQKAAHDDCDDDDVPLTQDRVLEVGLHTICSMYACMYVRINDQGMPRPLS